LAFARSASSFAAAIGHDTHFVQDNHSRSGRGVLRGLHFQLVQPQGKLVRVVPIPDGYVTNICFGGPDLKTAYITVSSSGKLVSMKWDRPGLKLNFSA
jgi:hypothetical protein